MSVESMILHPTYSSWLRDVSSSLVVAEKGVCSSHKLENISQLVDSYVAYVAWLFVKAKMKLFARSAFFKAERIFSHVTRRATDAFLFRPRESLSLLATTVSVFRVHCS